MWRRALLVFGDGRNERRMNEALTKHREGSSKSVASNLQWKRRSLKCRPSPPPPPPPPPQRNRRHPLRQRCRRRHRRHVSTRWEGPSGNAVTTARSVCAACSRSARASCLATWKHASNAKTPRRRSGARRWASPAGPCAVNRRCSRPWVGRCPRSCRCMSACSGPASAGTTSRRKKRQRRRHARC